MPNKSEVQRQPEVLHLLHQEELILVIPFYNEALNIPQFFSSFSPAIDKNTFFIGVNHRSKDDSKESFATAVGQLGNHTIIDESLDVPSVGIPRQKGIKLALELARQEKTKGRKVVIGSIDMDTTIPASYLTEAQEFLSTNNDFLVFPTRYNPKILMDCIGEQAGERARFAAIRDLLGIDWLKFNLRSFLLRAGAIETRGSGGYFFTVDGYDKAGGHKPLYSGDGKLIVGESNALGIRATRVGSTYIASNTVVTANPRRMLQSISKSRQDYKITNEGKTFDTTLNISTMPKLTEEEWIQHFRVAMSGALRTFTIKSLAYGVSNNIRGYINGLPHFDELLDRMQKKYISTKFGGDEREAIGSVIYLDIYAQSISDMGERGETLLNSLAGTLPSEASLIDWAENENVKPIDKLSL